MPSEPSPSALRDLRALFDAGMAAGLTDDQLLRTYVERRAEAEAAFAALVDRHGPMVWGVCRRALGAAHDAEDAFQATFLILARRADAIRTSDPIGGWLHGVASRVAARARADGLRRRDMEARAASGRPTSDAPDPGRDERLAALDEELARLPEKYRSPMVLCHLEGLTYAGAADRLGCSPVAVKGRLARGLELLRARLGRRGLALPIPAVGGSILPLPGPAVPPSLARAAASAATSATVAAASATAVILAKGALRSMSMTRLIKSLALLAPTLALAGVWVQSTHSAIPEPKGPPRLIGVQEPEPGPGSIIVPLPAKDELRALLRRAAAEAIALATKDPHPASWTLMTLAQAQSRSGDRAGARETYAVATREAGGELGGVASTFGLYLVGRSQAESGLRDEALATLRRAAESIPGVVREFDQDYMTLRRLVDIVKDQARLGDRDQARRTADRLRAFTVELIAKSKPGNAKDVVAADLAGALAAVDDFEGAFEKGTTDWNLGNVAGKVAEAAAECLDRERARRYVDEAAARLDSLRSVDRTYFGLGDLARARACLGDFDGAKRTARAIGEGPTQVEYDMTDGQPYALIRVASVQREAGQFEAARETLREAYRTIVDHPKMRGPEGRFYQVALSQVDLGDVEGAQRSAEASSPGYRAEILAMIARAHALAGRAREARKAMDRALADARAETELPNPPRPDPPATATVKPFRFEAVSMMRLVEIRAMAGDLAEARTTLARIEQEAEHNQALVRMVRARATAGDVQGAFEMTTRDARTEPERTAALWAFGEGVERRLRMESR